MNFSTKYPLETSFFVNWGHAGVPLQVCTFSVGIRDIVTKNYIANPGIFADAFNYLR